MTKSVVELCRDLVNIKSYSGEEEQIANYILKYMKENNFDESFIDKYGNVIGCIKGKRKGKKILFDGHIDTVPVSDNWKHDPFCAQIEDGKIYGRGTTDMKGAVAAFLYAVVKFCSDTNRDFAGEIWVAGVVHEESFEGISARIISEYIKPDLVVIGEASEMNLKISQRGRAEIVLETFGTPCHSSNPDKGYNAVYSMMKVLDEIRKIKPVKQEGMYGDGILELTDIKSSPYPGLSVVPDYCKATFDRRLLVGETKESVLKPINVILDKIKKEDEKFSGRVSFATGKEKCYTGEVIESDRFFPAWKREKNEEYIISIKNEIENMGYDVECTGYSFCTNGSHYGGEKNIPCIGIGPSKENIAHIDDEYIKICELEMVTDYYIAVCKVML